MDHGCQDLGSWSTFKTRLDHIGMRMQYKVLSLIQKTLSGITLTSQEPGRRLFLTNQRDSCKRVWSFLMTRSALMFGLSWDRKPRRGRIISRPGRDLTPRNNFWLISKTRLPRLLTSPVASPATRKRLGMRPHPLTLYAEGST